jgi:hypothetical protein
MDAEETLYRSNWEQRIGVLGKNMHHCIASLYIFLAP